MKVTAIADIFHQNTLSESSGEYTLLISTLPYSCWSHSQNFKSVIYLQFEGEDKVIMIQVQHLEDLQ